MEAFRSGAIKSFQERMEERYGEAVDFNDPELQYEEKRIPVVFQHSRKKFEQKNKSHFGLDFIKDSVYDQLPPLPKKH